MTTLIHKLAYNSKPLKITSFSRQQGCIFKMRYYMCYQFFNTSTFVFKRFVRPIWTYSSASKYFSINVQNLLSITILTYRKARSYLPSKVMPSTFTERDTEASLTVSITTQIRFNIHHNFNSIKEIPAYCDTYKFALQKDTKYHLSLRFSRYGVKFLMI